MFHSLSLSVLFPLSKNIKIFFKKSPFKVKCGGEMGMFSVVVQ